MTLSTWARRYLDLLELEPGPAGLEWLNRFGEAHLRRLPFASVTSVLRRLEAGEGPVPPLDYESQLAAWEAGAGGAVCFEASSLVVRLLTELGYNAHAVLGEITFPGSHQAAVVALDGGAFLVDLGCGAPLPRPIPLDRDSEYHAAGLSYRFRPDIAGMTCVQDRLIGGDWKPFCRYDLGPATAEAREAAYQRNHDPSQTWVTSTFTLVRYMQDRDEVLQVRDGAFTRHTTSGKESRATTAGELEAIVHRDFGLPSFPVTRTLDALRRITGVLS